jgi:hypothetical protein
MIFTSPHYQLYAPNLTKPDPVITVGIRYNWFIVRQYELNNGKIA